MGSAKGQVASIGVAPRADVEVLHPAQVRLRDGTLHGHPGGDVEQASFAQPERHAAGHFQGGPTPLSGQSDPARSAKCRHSRR